MIDLHTHSTVSDGSDTPERVVELAAAAGCRAVALTDHDRTDGLDVAARRAAELGIEFIGGCELSCETPTGAMHLLVYFGDRRNDQFEAELVRLQSIRAERNLRMAERLRAIGLPVTLEELQAVAGGNGIGRPHAAAVLLHKGLVDSIQDAFDRYLARGRPGYVEKERLTPERAISLACGSGAVPVLAHPLSLELPPVALDEVVGRLSSTGLAGIEAVYSRYSPAERDGLCDLAIKHGLFVTGGSDYHGTYKPDLAVGVGRGDLHVPDDAAASLRASIAGRR